MTSADTTPKQPAPATKISRAAALAVATSGVFAPPPLSGKCHPACLLLPEMTEQEYRELVEDIRNNGQRHPIIVDKKGDILDGRHRHRALEELFEQPEVQIFDGTEEEKVALIISENVHRRHLTVQQRAAVAAELAEKLKDAAQKRQKAGTIASVDAKGKAAAQAAKMVGGVSQASVERARKRMREDPEAHEQAKMGKLGKRKPRPKMLEGDRIVREQIHEQRTKSRAASKGKPGYAPFLEAEFVNTGPLDDVVDWLLHVLSRDRLAALAERLEGALKGA